MVDALHIFTVPVPSGAVAAPAQSGAEGADDFAALVLSADSGTASVPADTLPVPAQPNAVLPAMEQLAATALDRLVPPPAILPVAGPAIAVVQLPLPAEAGPTTDGALPEESVAPVDLASVEATETVPNMAAFAVAAPVMTPQPQPLPDAASEGPVAVAPSSGWPAARPTTQVPAAVRADAASADAAQEMALSGPVLPVQPRTAGPVVGNAEKDTPSGAALPDPSEMADQPVAARPRPDAAPALPPDMRADAVQATGRGPSRDASEAAAASKGGEAAVDAEPVAPMAHDPVARDTAAPMPPAQPTPASAPLTLQSAPAFSAVSETVSADAPGQAGAARSEQPVPIDALPALLVSHADGGPAEIHLEPLELGRLRLDVVADGKEVQVTLAAERADTSDLLRRFAAELVSEFRQAGFVQVTVGFGAWGEGRGQQQPQNTPVTQWDDTQVATAQAGAQAVAALISLQPRVPSRGLNLRL